MTFKRFAKITALTLACFVTAIVSFLYFWYKSGGLQSAVLLQAGKSFLTIAANPQSDATDIVSMEAGANFVQKFFGMEEPQTILVLFLNNTEIRPGGGFIGAYAVIKMDKANPEIIKVEGTEVLDNSSPRNFESIPPAPIKDHLGLERWYFRDSNWSPDFKISSAKSLELYKKENGANADEIGAVVGFTPTVMEELLRVTGPITVNGETFTAENFTEKLEREVEYDFAEKGLGFEDRKQILKDLAKSVVASSMKNVFKSWNEYKSLIEKMLAQKQIMMYSPDEEYQNVFEAKNWAGEMSVVDHDYLLWADANLGALKTDASIDRTLSYEISAPVGGKYLARAKMTYNHKGTFDWRTTRYLNYARVFVPEGSEIVSAYVKTSAYGSVRTVKADTGVENGKRWFGTFVSIEPGNMGEVTFEYYLAPQAAARIAANDYKLLVQKQLGTNNVGLTLGLNFANTLAYVSPGENSNDTNNHRYDYSTTLIQDVEVEVRTK